MNRIVVFLSIILWSVGAYAQDFDVYVVDAGNFSQPPWQILKYDRDGVNPEIFINQNLDWPHDLLFLEDEGIALVSNFNSGNIERFDAETGQYIDNFASQIPGPTRMKIGPDGLLYVLSASANARVKRYQLDGTFVDDFTSIGLPRSLGLDWDARGYLYVSSYDFQLVRVFDTEGNDQGSFVSTNLNGPTNIWFDDDGDLLVVDYDVGAVARFDPSGAYQGNFIVGLSQAEGVDFLPGGDILIGNGGTSAIKSFTKQGAFIEDFVASQYGGLMQPNAVVVRQKQLHINIAMTDAWFNPATNGQGFFVTVFPVTGQLFLAWMTYDTQRPSDDVTANLGEPGHRWLTAQGPYKGNKAVLRVYLTQGGVFDSPEPPAITDQDGSGTLTVEFNDCNAGWINYDIPSLGLAGDIPITRIVEDNVLLCEELQ